jgi:hypothetical protein
VRERDTPRKSSGVYTLRNTPSFPKKKKKKGLVVVDAKERVDNTSNLHGKISCTIVQKEVSLVSYSPKEEKEMIELFHIKIHMKQTKVDFLFNLGSQLNLIFAQLVEKLGLETHDHPQPYPLGWVRQDVELRVVK